MKGLTPEELERFLEPERYELREPPAYRFEMDRREFVTLLGAGILVSVGGSGAFAQDRGRRRGRRRGRSSGGGSIAERLHIGADGSITVLTGKVDVGQGSRTQISMAAAEELRVPVSSIRLVMADSALVPDDGGTSGSRTTPSTVPRVRRACAAARQLLVDAAAQRWGVEPGAVSLRDGKAAGPRPEQLLGFGEIVEHELDEGKGFERQAEPDVSVTPVTEWKVLGKSVPALGGTEIVKGAHAYPSDIVRPGMLHGVVLRPPSYGARLASIDLDSARRLDGVVAVRDGDFVGFAAPTSFRAAEAREAASASARWEEAPAHPSSDDVYRLLRERAVPGGRRRGRRGGVRERGSVDAAFAEAGSVLRETYRIAYIQHAPMEPRAAVAEWQEGSLTVWTGTQNPERVRRQLAEAFRMPRERVRVIVPDTGGGFGGKHTGETAIEAARLAREADKPVSLRWTREEEFTWAYFRPAGVIDVAGALDGKGSLVAWEQINFNSGGSAVETPYEIPNTRTGSRESDAPLRQGSYRALAATANVFAREAFMDRLAAAAETDPLAFRLRHLPEGRLRDVLEKAAERFGWERRRKETEGSRTRGVGLACGTEKASCTAACVEVEVLEEKGRFRVVEVSQAFECGAIQNPKNLRAQVEGCIIQGLGGALFEEIRFRDGKVLNGRFSRYRVPRFRDVPKIDTLLVDRRDLPSVGAGETPIVAVAPAIAGALYAATGERFLSLPLRTERYRSV